MNDDDERGYARRWLAYAKGDLLTARAGRKANLRPRIIAFHAQQSAEKALKAALVLEDIRPPARHDLEELRARLPAGWSVKTHPASLARLSDYGIEAKYPDNAIQVRPIDSAVAVRQAITVLRLVEDGFKRRGVRTDDLKPA